MYFLPDVKKPFRHVCLVADKHTCLRCSPLVSLQVKFQDKLMYTLVTLLVFLVMSQIPLYGVATKSSSDPFYWMRVILASNR